MPMTFGEKATKSLVERLGPQRASDSPLLRRVRAHQSWYRLEVLELPDWGKSASPRETALGSVLTVADAFLGHNFVSLQARHAYEQRRLTGWGVDPVRCERYMTSSQALTLNVLGPLLSDSTWSARTFGKVLGEAIVDVSRSFIEYAPRERLKLIGDRTIADGYFEFQTSGGSLALIVETKFADGFGARNLDVAHSTKYLDINERLKLWDEDSEQFGAGKFDQLARVHTLGSVMSSARTAVLVLHHSEDVRTPQVAARYRETLTDPTLLVVRDLREFLASMSDAASSRPQRKLVEALGLRYVDHDKSEKAWLDLGGSRYDRLTDASTGTRTDETSRATMKH